MYSLHNGIQQLENVIAVLGLQCISCLDQDKVASDDSKHSSQDATQGSAWDRKEASSSLTKTKAGGQLLNPAAPEYKEVEEKGAVLASALSIVSTETLPHDWLAVLQSLTSHPVVEYIRKLEDERFVLCFP